MNLHFYKYQGAGNDFIIIDNRTQQIALKAIQIHNLCDRRFGIGADGLMLLEKADGFDFKMVYFNADGNESTMCGNGGRCIASLAHRLGIGNKSITFTAIDGRHIAIIKSSDIVSLQMQDVNHIDFEKDVAILNTGSPHYVTFVNDVNTIDVFEKGRQIRNYKRFSPKGINVNFVEKQNDLLKIRTYERGVEDETLACGTGVTAAAIASVGDHIGKFDIDVTAVGGNLQVHFEKVTKDAARAIWLTGPANSVFEGDIIL